MNILALNPKDYYTGWPVQSDFGRELYRCPALTFPVLKRLLPSGNEMRFIDGFFEPINMRKYLDAIRWADVVLFNIASSYSSLNYAIAIKQVKRINPRAKIIAGGHHSYIFRKRWLELGVDLIATGEGELMFGSLIEELAGRGRFENVPGVAFLSDGEYVETQGPPQIQSLDESPEPDLDLINFSAYPSLLCPGGYVGSLECSRGCIFRCKFCTTPVYWKGTQRYKSTGRVEKEVKALLLRGVRQINILDDGFGNDREYTVELIRLLSRYRESMVWSSFMRIDTVLEEPRIIELGGESGLRMVLIGFESLNGDVLSDCIGKGLRVRFDLKAIQEIYKLFRRHKILVIGTFIAGHPDMNEEDTTSYWLARTVCDDPRLADYMPIPLTRGYNEWQEKYPVKDMFFHDAKLRIYPGHNVRAFWFNFLNIIDIPRSIKLLFSGYNYRNYLITSHKKLWWKLFRVNRRKLRDYWLMCRRALDSDSKQEQLFRWYLEDLDYERWLDSQEQLVWF